MLGKLAFVAIFFKSAGHSNHPELLLSTGLSVPTQMAKAKKNLYYLSYRAVDRLSEE